MKASELKVGDRVRLVSEHDSPRAPVGHEGTVVKLRPYDADVVWDGDYSDGHNGDAKGYGVNHWYLYDGGDSQKWEIVKPLKKKASVAKQIYKGNGKHTWEVVVKSEDEFAEIRRLRVPTGWLYHDGMNAPVYVPCPEFVHPI